MNIEERLRAAEEELARLEQQQAQMQALQEIMPIRFAENMSAFEKWLPDIAQLFENYEPRRPFSIFCNHNGIPNLHWKESDENLYPENPFDYCQAQIHAVLHEHKLIRYGFEPQWDPFKQQHMLYVNELARRLQLFRQDESFEPLVSMSGDVPFMLLFGVGLGYHLGYLYEQCIPENLYLVEPDMDIFFASLFTFDWAPLLEYIQSNGLGLHLFLGQDEESIMADFRTALFRDGSYLITTMMGFAHYGSKPIISLQRRISEEFHALSMGWGFFDDNLFGLANAYRTISDGVPFFRSDRPLVKRLSEVPVFVVANGPSLDRDIDYIRAHQSGALIIACGTAIWSLYRAGIKPDFYLAIERATNVSEHLASLGINDYLADIPMIATDIIHPKTRAFFKRVVVGFKIDDSPCCLFATNNRTMARYIGFDCANPLVGNLGLSVPLHLGFRHICLFGVDNGFRSEGHHHSRLSSYYDADGNPLEAFAQMALAIGEHWRPANFGGEVQTNKLFTQSILSAEVLLTHFNEVNVYNCSDGAMLRGAQPCHADALPLNYPPVDKGALVDALLTQHAEPIALGRDEILSYMDPELFDGLLDRVMHIWSREMGTRREVVAACQLCTSFIKPLIATRHAFIHRVLFGEFNYLFSLMINMAYCGSDEATSMQLVNENRPLLLEFFERMKRMYPCALDYVQGEHQGVVPDLPYGSTLIS